MPLLAPSAQPTPQVSRVGAVDRRRLDFQSLTGEMFEFAVESFIGKGMEGIDVPPREVSETDGGSGLPRISVIRDLPADMMIPLMVSGADYRDNLRQLKSLRSFFDYRGLDYTRTDGTFDLVASDAGRVRRRRCFYKSGLEGSYSAQSHGPKWLTRGLELRSVWPYWRGEAWSTGEIRLPVPSPFLSNSGNAKFGHQRLSASRVLGDPMPVSVGGDVPSPAVLELHGPFSSALVTSNSGLKFSIGPIGSGDFLVIDTGRDRRVELNNGGVNSGAALIGRGAQWLPLLPDNASVTVALVGATVDTFAVVSGEALHESPWASEDS